VETYGQTDSRTKTIALPPVVLTWSVKMERNLHVMGHNIQLTELLLNGLKISLS